MTQLDLQQRLEQAEEREQSAAGAAVVLAEQVAVIKAERDALQQKVSALAAQYSEMQLAMALSGLMYAKPNPQQVEDYHNGIKAEGAKEFSVYLREWYSPDVENHAEEFANQLRAQGASNEQD